MSGTDYTTTPNLGLFKPNANAAVGFWGDLLNSNADAIDAAIHFASGGGPFLPLAGGNASGPINVTVTGTPLARSIQDSLADAVNVKSFGAIMDGASHPLSSKYGSLGAAQAVYPHATSITDEIDWCAIQGCVNAGNTAIRIPAGSALINKPIVSSTANITIIGDGTEVSSIVQNAAGQDGWQHSSAARFQMFGLRLTRNGTGGVALNLNFTGGAPGPTLRDVAITGNGNATTNYWHDGIVMVGAGLVFMDNVSANGIQAGDLSLVGNGIYIAPRTVTTPVGCYQVVISNSTFDYWQNGVVLDSNTTSLTNNIQGVLLDWVTSVGCMQFVRVANADPTKSSILDLVIERSNSATYGSAVYTENAYSVWIRDSYFIGYPPNAARAIVAQLPQDMVYANDGGTWWVKDNRFQINAGSTWNYVFNFQNTFNGALIRDNSVITQGVTAMLGYINIANGCNTIDESGTQLGFWGAWPKIVNGNPSGGGAGNKVSMGTLVTATTLTGELWQHSGAFVGHNYTTGRGATDFVNSRGALAGGYYFYTTTSDLAATPTLLAAISNNAIFTCNGLITKSVPVTGTAYTLAATDSSLVLNPSGAFVITLGPATASNTGRIVCLKSIAAFAVTSNANNIVQLTGGAANNVIFPATAGKWCVLQSDGTAWQIMQAN